MANQYFLLNNVYLFTINIFLTQSASQVRRLFGTRFPDVKIPSRSIAWFYSFDYAAELNLNSYNSKYEIKINLFPENCGNVVGCITAILRCLLLAASASAVQSEIPVTPVHTCSDLSV